MKSQDTSSIVATSRSTSQLGRRDNATDMYRKNTKHVPGSTAHAAILASIAPGVAFHGFSDLEVKDIVVKLSAGYTDPTNWFFELAVQPVRARVRPTEEAVTASLKFIQYAQVGASFVAGVRAASNDPDASADEPGLRESLMKRLLDSKVVVPVHVPRRDMHKSHKYDATQQYKIQTPGNLVLQAVDYYSHMLSKGRRAVAAPWNQAERLAPGDVNNFGEVEADNLIRAFRSVMDTASAIEEVEGTVWPLEAVTPRPPTSENPTPSMTVWAKCAGWSPTAKIWKLRCTLQSGVFRTERCVPEVRFGDKNGPIFQEMENPVPVFISGKGRKMVPGWHSLAGLPPLSAGCPYLTSKFVPRQDILEMAPQLAAWLVNDKSAQKVACLQQMASVHASDRKLYAAAAGRYLTKQPLTDNDKNILADYRGAALLLFIQRSVEDQLAEAELVNQTLEQGLDEALTPPSESEVEADLVLTATAEAGVEVEADLVLPATAEAGVEVEADLVLPATAEAGVEVEADQVVNQDV